MVALPILHTVLVHVYRNIAATKIKTSNYEAAHSLSTCCFQLVEKPLRKAQINIITLPLLAAAPSRWTCIPLQIIHYLVLQIPPSKYCNQMLLQGFVVFFFFFCTL
jgi:hypothetical protein